MREITKDNGGAAFPTHAGGIMAPVQGMSLRDYFAGEVIANVSNLRIGTEKDVTQKHFQERATYAYRIADAMLEERNK